MFIQFFYKNKYVVSKQLVKGCVPAVRDLCHLLINEFFYFHVFFAVIFMNCLYITVYAFYATCICTMSN